MTEDELKDLDRQFKDTLKSNKRYDYITGGLFLIFVILVSFFVFYLL